jgi:hypothetical protein
MEDARSSSSTNTTIDWQEVSSLLEALYKASGRLEEVFPGRKFTLDGHLVGSIGEVIAAYMFDLTLVTASTQAHDALTRDGRRVEIKLTQGDSTGIRHPPEHLIVLHRPKGGPVRVSYNGPGLPAWEQAGKLQSNGQRTISLRKLSEIDSTIPEESRLPIKSPPPV